MFGREDGGGEDSFVFSQSDIDAVLCHCAEMLRPHLLFGGEAQYGRQGPTYGHVYALERNQAQCLLALCISDTHKTLLLANPAVVTHLVHGLMLDPAYHRTGERDTTDFAGIKAAVQRDYAECLQQLSLFPEGREVMIRDPAVTEALHALVSAGDELCWSGEARRCAHGALMALEDRDHRGTVVHGAGGGGGGGGRREEGGLSSSPERDDGWAMLSYSWEHQKAFIRLNGSLQARGYTT